MLDSNRFNYRAVRTHLVKKGFFEFNVVRYLYRPFDVRWIYWEPETKLLGEKSPDYFPQVSNDNLWLFTTGRTRRETPEPAYSTTLLTDLNFQDSGARGAPLKLRDAIMGQEQSERDNLSAPAVAYLKGLGENAETLFFHTLAILNSPAYRDENATALSQDWARIPLPVKLENLRASAVLGRQVAVLLNTEIPVPGVTCGAIKSELRAIGQVTCVHGGTLKPQEFTLNAGWGRTGLKGVTMPGRGKALSREARPEEVGILVTGDNKQTFDIWLNNCAYWKNIPPAVWDFTVGGYQVIKKWLSYREQSLLGRVLSVNEVREVTAMARRIAALIILHNELDASYWALMGDTLTIANETSFSAAN